MSLACLLTKSCFASGVQPAQPTLAAAGPRGAAAGAAAARRRQPLCQQPGERPGRHRRQQQGGWPRRAAHRGASISYLYIYLFI